MFNSSIRPSGLLERLVGNALGVFEDWRLDSSNGILVAPDGLLDMLDCLRSKELFSRFSTHSSRNMFNDIELSIMFETVSYGCFNHCFFHEE